MGMDPASPAGSGPPSAPGSASEFRSILARKPPIPKSKLKKGKGIMRDGGFSDSGMVVGSSALFSADRITESLPAEVQHWLSSKLNSQRATVRQALGGSIGSDAGKRLSSSSSDAP